MTTFAKTPQPFTTANPHTSLLSFSIKTKEQKWGDGSVSYAHRIVIQPDAEDPHGPVADGADLERVGTATDGE